jgi:hypothetical protein
MLIPLIMNNLEGEPGEPAAAAKGRMMMMGIG